ncbi:MAG: phospholipid carrier-dependent glycosyltransferase [Acidimicrobiales bacterium]
MIDRREPSRLVTALGLGLILLVGGWFRLTGIDFDRGAHLHPDERFLAIVASAISAPDGPRDYFDTEHTDLNPANHDLQTVYGTAPIFAGKGLAAWLHGGAAEGRQPARAVVVALDRAGLDLLDDDGAPTFDAGYELVLVGRFLSAVLDLGTVLVAFELGRVLRGRATGLASAFAYACCVLAVQQAHFFVVDPMLTFATALALLAAVHVARGRGRWTLAAGGVAAGVAGASKVGGLSVLAVLVAATAVASADGLGAALRRHTPWRARARALAPFVAGSAIAVGAAATTFRLLQPYAFVGLVRLDPRWTRILDDLARLQDGADLPPNIQWAGRVPVLEALGHQVRFGVGIGATLLAIAGLAAIVRRRTWQREPALALIAGWVALTGAIFLPGGSSPCGTSSRRCPPWPCWPGSAPWACCADPAPRRGRRPRPRHPVVAARLRARRVPAHPAAPRRRRMGGGPRARRCHRLGIGLGRRPPARGRHRRPRRAHHHARPLRPHHARRCPSPGRPARPARLRGGDERPGDGRWRGSPPATARSCGTTGASTTAASGSSGWPPSAPPPRCSASTSTIAARRRRSGSTTTPRCASGARPTPSRSNGPWR